MADTTTTTPTTEEEEVKATTTTPAPNIDPQSGLLTQDLENLNPSELTPLTPEIISRQATINIGTIGHVAHGKSTVVKAISGVNTVKFRSERSRNITMKLGYANAKVYKCNNPQHEAPSNYYSFGSAQKENPNCPKEDCVGTLVIQRHVSFVDCPGHDILMATMLNGAAVMDAAMLLVAANESCPQPQTSEHLAAVEIMKLSHIIILQNKIDVVTKPENAEKQYLDIKKFVSGTLAEKAPILPISAQLKYNIDIICEYLCKTIPIPMRDFVGSPRLIVIRSFDVNRPGEEVEKLQGGVAGGSILQGVLKVGDEVEIRPGIVGKEKDGQIKCSPIFSKIVSLKAEQNDLKYAVPGGLIGVGLKVDPALTRGDRLVGHVLGHPGQLPDIFTELEISYYLLRRLLGVKSDKEKGKTEKVSSIKRGEMLMVNVGSTSAGGRVLGVKSELAKLQLTTPVCTSEGEKIALSRRVEKRWRLIGWGMIKKGTVYLV
eukprot:CAMPEP_0115035580 /NCGR_PEP_ID=MMETSP0216-20121206/41540_1 /TAXON_ID=223996 /ORGANISM="Protocruzia adherens, Strain Boccale" /LENGTH=487 /DNA_ID=CAMNT_0002415101 /DNA_START=146 /DNA_END=1609 /DNA_ORIENTATION=-